MLHRIHSVPAFIALIVAQIAGVSVAFAGPLDDQRQVEVAMKAVLPGANCERGGRYKAACYHKREADEFSDASIVLTHENRVVISIPFHAKYTEQLGKFYESLRIAYEASALSRCWSNSYMKKLNLNQGAAEWVTPEIITICDQDRDAKTLNLEIYSNNRF